MLDKSLEKNWKKNVKITWIWGKLLPKKLRLYFVNAIY